ncbi:MAG: ABC transporter permease [Eggerthellaceae bacterium]|jgi:ABC-2 type transport system permease protein|nr:ABC transporter permease [Eggerthellaceae bacterium]MDR2721901.1 ABC transporter permease [Coriobacteriaceae bacterium]
MNGFGAFFSKEIVQTLRSFRLLIVVGIFILLGLMNAPMAKFTPQILELAGVGELTGAMGLAEPTALDAWMQFFGNVAQMGILAILLICGAALSGEKSKGTLVLPLTKGLGRAGVILAKYLVATLLWALGMLVAALVSWALTLAIFPGENFPNLVFSIAMLWLFGQFLLSLIPLSSVLFKGSMSGLIIPGAILFILLILTSFPDLFFWNPALLATGGANILMEAKEPLDYLVAGIVSLVTIVGAPLVAILVFRKTSL